MLVSDSTSFLSLLLEFYSYFVAYELSKQALTPAGQDPSKLNLGAVIVAGGMAGVAMWSFAIPPDVRRWCCSRSNEALP